jgi:hypothetical protein
MKTQIIAAAFAAVLAMGTAAFADTAPQSPATTAQATTTNCTPAADPAIPLAITVTTTQVNPIAAPPVFGATNRGSCVGTAQYAPASQPFMSAYPYAQAWWVFGPFPPQQYRGT